jgi:N-acylneuraminate cytidylyltransferase
MTINPLVHIYLLSVPPVRGRIDRSNNVIKELNTCLKQCFDDVPNLSLVELSSEFYDCFGNLPAEFTYDGLHFSELAYQQLEREITEVLK